MELVSKLKLGTGTHLSPGDMKGPGTTYLSPGDMSTQVKNSNVYRM